MAAGFRSPLPHLGISGSSAQGGFRTPLPGWNAGGGTGAQGSFRTPLPGWNAGGVAADQAGFKSLLAFWGGGAGGLEPSAEPPGPQPSPGIGGAYFTDIISPHDLRHLSRADEEALVLAIALIQSGVIE